MHTVSKQWHRLPSYICTSLPAVFNSIYGSTNQQLFKKNFCNQISSYENYEWFPLKMEVIPYLPQNQHFS